MSTGRENAVSTRWRAGSALSPPTRTPATDTPGGITRVGAAAGAAAQARPAASSRAATVLSTRPKLNHVLRQLASFGRLSEAAETRIRPAPSVRSTICGDRNLAARALRLSGGVGARRGAGAGRGDRGGAGAPRLSLA